MHEYVKKMNLDKYTEVVFDIECERIIAIAEKMQALDENVYRNGYNWESFLNCYLAKMSPDLLEGMQTDPEAGMYVAYYDLSPANELKAAKFAEVICDLVENEKKIYSFLREHGAEIAWD